MAAEKNEITTKDKADIAVAEPVQTDIRSLIYVARGQQVMLDSDLAMLYQVETGNCYAFINGSHSTLCRMNFKE